MEAQTNGNHVIDEIVQLDPDPANALEYMKVFTSAQATRTAIYHEFEHAIEDHANGSIGVPEIQQVIRIAQEGFQDVSSEIIHVERVLVSLGLIHLSNIIRQVQDLEREKLEVTVNLLSFQIQATSRPEISYESVIDDLKAKRQALIDKINEAMENARADMLDL
ncbi:hypothetical protein V1512DRAFT_270530 [Lipomyces arxii]|uniref:uncharacterized protein n=1 Tax=Lipomyces arxii TaxID=56418 RepID=UPI0034CF6B67